MVAHWHSNKKTIQLPLTGSDALKVFICFAIAYFISYSFRSINAVISPELIVDLQLNNNHLGLLSSAYLIGFGLAQIPVGILLDRYGPKITEVGLMSLAVLGALLFYTADNLIILFIARMLIGIGVSSCLMSALTGFRSWYSIAQQPQLTSAILIFGTSGALLTSSPARMILPYIGWRCLFLLLAIACTLSILILYLYLPTKNSRGDSNKNIATPDSQKLFSWENYRPILANAFYWRLFPVGAISLGGFMAIQTLWLGPWLINVKGQSSDTASETVFWFNTVLLLTYTINTYFLPKLQKIGIHTVRYLTWMTGASLVAQGGAYFLHESAAVFWWYLYAATSASFVLAQSLIITRFPKSHSGRASTTYNITIFIGAFLTQWGIGYGIDKGVSWGLTVTQAFDLSLGIYLFIQILGFSWLLFSPRFFQEAVTADGD